jgi:hypothetical protein
MDDNLRFAGRKNTCLCLDVRCPQCECLAIQPPLLASHRGTAQATAQITGSDSVSAETPNGCEVFDVEGQCDMLDVTSITRKNKDTSVAAYVPQTKDLSIITTCQQRHLLVITKRHKFDPCGHSS